MHSPQTNKGLEDQFALPPIDDLESFFPDANCSFTYGVDKATTNVNVDNNESTYKLNHHLANQDSELDLVGDSMSHKLESTTIAAPLASQSNPETPKEQFDFTLGDFAPTMTRIFSEQSGLASLNPNHSDHPDNVHPDNVRQNLIKNQHQNHQLASVPMRRSDSYVWPQEIGAMKSSADGNLSMPAMSYNQHQAGLDLGAQHGVGARHSYLRTPLRPSGLRNSISSQPADIYPSVSQVVDSNPHFMQPTADISTAQEHLHAPRNRRHTDAPIFPRNPLINPYPMFDQNPMYGGFMGSLTSYADPNRVYSLPDPPRSVYHSHGMHGNLVHPNADSHQHINGMLLQPPMDLSPYNFRPHQQSVFGQRMQTTMKREELSSNSCPQRVSYQSMEETEVAKGVQTENLDETPLAPITAEEKELYLNKILAAMYDTSRAQDNAGMISAWKTQMNDKEAVEGIARDLLVSLLYQMIPLVRVVLTALP